MDRDVPSGTPRQDEGGGSPESLPMRQPRLGPHQRGLAAGYRRLYGSTGAGQGFHGSPGVPEAPQRAQNLDFTKVVQGLEKKIMKTNVF